MRELALHLLDLGENALRAGAARIALSVTYRAGLLELRVRDDGRGMTATQSAQAADPWYTTRPGAVCGLGLPLLRAAALRTGGTFSVCAAPGAGTNVYARFVAGHVDCPPMGSLVDTVCALLLAETPVRVGMSLRVGAACVRVRSDLLPGTQDAGHPLSAHALTAVRSGLLEQLSPLLLHVDGGYWFNENA